MVNAVLSLRSMPLMSLRTMPEFRFYFSVYGNGLFFRFLTREVTFWLCFAYVYRRAIRGNVYRNEVACMVVPFNGKGL